MVLQLFFTTFTAWFGSNTWYSGAHQNSWYLEHIPIDILNMPSFLAEFPYWQILIRPREQLSIWNIKVQISQQLQWEQQWLYPLVRLVCYWQWPIEIVWNMSIYLLKVVIFQFAMLSLPEGNWSLVDHSFRRKKLSPLASRSELGVLDAACCAKAEVKSTVVFERGQRDSLGKVWCPNLESIFKQHSDIEFDYIYIYTYYIYIL